MEDAIRLLFNFDNKLFANKKRKKHILDVIFVLVS